jgi:hypothetical protein
MSEGLTTFPGRLMIESDYLNLARALLADTPCEPTDLSLECPCLCELVLTVRSTSSARAIAAAELLQEFWLYDWMPVNVRIGFKPALDRRSIDGHRPDGGRDHRADVRQGQLTRGA